MMKSQDSNNKHSPLEVLACIYIYTVTWQYEDNMFVVEKIMQHLLLIQQMLFIGTGIVAIKHSDTHLPYIRTHKKAIT